MAQNIYIFKLEVGYDAHNMHAADMIGKVLILVTCDVILLFTQWEMKRKMCCSFH